MADLSCIDPDTQKAGQYLEEMRKLGLQVISVTGVGGNVFDAENKMLPEGIFHYLKSSADNSDREGSKAPQARPPGSAQQQLMRQRNREGSILLPSLRFKPIRPLRVCHSLTT